MNINKNTSKIVITLFLIFSIILSIFSNVHAADTRGTITLSVDKSSSYKVGETVVINIDLSVSGFDGVMEFLADVEYDKTVLKYTGIKPSQGWSIISSDDQVYIESKIDRIGRLCQITFEVLKVVPETTVQLTNTDTSGTNGTALSLIGTLNEPSITIKEEKEPENPTPENPTPDDPTPENPTPDDPTPENPTPDDPTPDNPTPDDPTPENPTPDDPTPDDPTPENPTPDDPTQNNPTQDPTKNQTQQQNKKPDTAPGKIPQTGYFGLEIIIGILLITVAIVLIKYTKYKEIK